LADTLVVGADEAVDLAEAAAFPAAVVAVGATVVGVARLDVLLPLQADRTRAKAIPATTAGARRRMAFLPDRARSCPIDCDAVSRLALRRSRERFVSSL